MPTRVKIVRPNRAPSHSEQGIVGTAIERVWGSVLDAIPDGISVHSPSGAITFANRRLCDIYDKPLSELKSLNCNQIFHGDASVCPHEQVMATGHSMELVDRVHVSGGNFSVTLEPLYDESNEPCGFIRVMSDVTGGGRREDQLLETERFATLGQLLSGVAHDVGTPLNVISGYAEFLLMRRKPEDQGYKEISAILDQTHRIAAIFSRALDLARPAQGRSDAIDIQALLADTLDLVRHHLRKAGVTAGVTCRNNKPLIYGEGSQLRQAFFNLLLNAGQQIGAGGRLQVVVDETGDKPGVLGLALLGNAASGVGHDFSTLFAALGGIDTTGMGLCLTRKILADAGAKISVTDAGEQGVGLVISLPMNAGSGA